MHELDNVAKFLCGDIETDADGVYICIRTDDNTSKENYDNLMYMCDDIRALLTNYEIVELWADHDTQIIEFKLKD